MHKIEDRCSKDATKGIGSGIHQVQAFGTQIRSRGMPTCLLIFGFD
jgi:hypothetical protein